MAEALSTFFSVFLFVFLAELADKTQLLVFFLTSRYKKWDTFFGVMAASAILMAIVVFPVEYIRKFLPIYYIKLAGGIILILFGVIGLFNKPSEEDSGIKVKTFNIHPLFLVTAAFFIAEMGDRTQLAGLSFALKYKKLFFVWLGAWLGLFLANVPVIFGGHFIMRKIKPIYLYYIGTLMFLVIGIYVVLETLFF